MEVAMVNDLILGFDEARISAHDRGLYFGDGVYEVLMCWGGKLFAMDEHIQRLGLGLKKMDMLDKVNLDQIRDRVEQAVKKANMSEAMVYFHVTRGKGPRAHDWTEDWAPSFLLTVRKAPSSNHQEVPVISHPDWRWKRCDIKSLNLLANVLAKNAARKAGAYEAIMFDEQQLVTEAALHTVMLIQNGALQTAPLSANILPSITRALVLNHAEDLGLEVLEKSFTINEALAADELMIIGTTIKAAGVTHLDGKQIANGKVGPGALRVRNLLTEMMQS
ncbi:MAG: hypothetical protein GY869_17505 [Planctomycetes bacterium]|nr:hypothetical protein [Planctomycetota bacterium]